MTNKQFNSIRRVAKQLHTMADNLWEQSKVNGTFEETQAYWFLIENANNVIQYLWVMKYMGLVKNDYKKSID